LRGVWSCIFSREEAVRGTVVDAMYNLHLKDSSGEQFVFGVAGP
jgi:hypothetical protein